MALTRPELIDWTQFGVDDAPQIEARFNISPGTEVITVREREGKRVAQPTFWGLIPSWAKDRSMGNRMVIARADTAFEKPAFKRAMLARRCLIPVDAFYEWQGASGEPGRQPWAVRLRGGQPFTLGGLWEYWRPEGEEEGVVSFAVLTTDPNATLAPIHDRMPVILRRADEDAWLDPSAPEPKLLSLLAPYDAAPTALYRVDARVNSVKNDDPQCLARLEQ